MATIDITILGGGISGLSLAHYCAASGMHAIVLEKDERAGGALHSHRTADSDFWLELGAHTCYNSYGNLIEIMDRTGALDQIRPRESVPFRVLANGGVRSIFGRIDYPELLLSAPRMMWKRRTGATVKGFYSAILGRGNYEKLFRHFFNAVPSQETDEFPADLLFKSRPRRKDVLRSYTLAGGLQTIGETICRAADVEFVGRARVASIERGSEGFLVHTEEGTDYASEILALALPAPAAAQLLWNLEPELARRISQIETATVHSVGVIVRRDLVKIEPVAGIISPSDLFYSAVSRDTVSDERYRGFTFHFKPEIIDANRRIERICEVLKIDAMSIEEVAVKENILPSLKVGHEARVREIDALRTDAHLLLTGNYFGGVAIEDCVTRSKSEFERLKRG